MTDNPWEILKRGCAIPDGVPAQAVKPNLAAFVSGFERLVKGEG